MAEQQALADMERAGCARANRRAERCMVKVGNCEEEELREARGCKLIISSLSQSSGRNRLCIDGLTVELKVFCH